MDVKSCVNGLALGTNGSNCVQQGPPTSYSATASSVVAQEANSLSRINMANGHKDSSTNGVAANGVKANGVAANGVKVNGVAVTNGLSKLTSTAPSRLIELAHTITRETEKLDKYLKESGSSMPSFDVDAPADFPRLPEEIQRARQKVVESTKELGDLAVGPTEGIRWMAWDVSSPFKPSVADPNLLFLKSIR